VTEYIAVAVPGLLLAWAGYFFYSRGVSSERAISSKSPLQTDGVPMDTTLNKVLILTAAVGGGHEAAGRTVRAELERSGSNVVIRDGLRTMSRALSWLLNWGYCNQVRNTPKSLGAIFAVTSRRAGAATVRATVSLLFAKRLLKVVRREQPDLVVSTYPLVNSALGHLRSSGRLRVPAAAIIADYGVHPLWVAPTLDLHLVVSRHSTGLAEHAGGLASVVRMPVAPGFYSPPTRDEARATLGLPQEAFVALIVGGAWGIGNLSEATQCAAEASAHTLVVTGNNARLKARLEERFRSEEKVRIMGWREDMPVLMAAADCLIQNAGGMTCVEAIEMGLPILIFDPILGHGELNAKVMELAGVARQVGTAKELNALLRSAVRSETSLLAPSRELAAPTVSTVLESLAVGSVPEPARTRWALSPRPVLASVSLLAFLFWLAFAPMGVAVAAKGFHTHIPGYNPSPGEIALGVRVTDPATAAALENSIQRERIPVTIFANAQAAESLHPAGRITFGVAEEPGNRGAILPWRIRTEAQNTAAELQRQTGAQPEYFLPALRTNLTSLTEAPPHTEPVVPEWTNQGESPSGLLIVDTSGLSPEAARLKLVRTLHDIRDKNLRCVPLAEL
jgi:processive 1,2-diacylglycerol beta-glucosyltransferase